MGTTPQGLPYPEPTDPIAGGADAIKNLAAAVNQPLTGVVTLTGNGTATGSATITFPAGWFTAAPRVFVTPLIGWVVNATAVTATGATLQAQRNDGSNFSTSGQIQWMAVR